MKDGEFEKLLYGLEYEAFRQGKYAVGTQEYADYQRKISEIQEKLIDEYNRLNARIKELEDNND